MICYDIPQTVNEIILQRQEREDARMVSFAKPTAFRYKVGEIVEFDFHGQTKKGRITTAIHKSGVSVYNIETPTHQWFQKIAQEAIIRAIG